MTFLAGGYLLEFRGALEGGASGAGHVASEQSDSEQGGGGLRGEIAPGDFTGAEQLTSASSCLVLGYGVLVWSLVVLVGITE